jgi:hypothetical protein
MKLTIYLLIASCFIMTGCVDAFADKDDEIKSLKQQFEALAGTYLDTRGNLASIRNSADFKALMAYKDFEVFFFNQVDNSILMQQNNLNKSGRAVLDSMTFYSKEIHYGQSHDLNDSFMVRHMIYQLDKKAGNWTKCYVATLEKYKKIEGVHNARSGEEIILYRYLY